jgi:hypothetical protein
LKSITFGDESRKRWAGGDISSFFGRLKKHGKAVLLMGSGFGHDSFSLGIKCDGVNSGPPAKKVSACRGEWALTFRSRTCE